MFDKSQLNRLYQYALSLTHNPDDAYDILQASLETALKSTARFSAVDYPLGYMRAMIRNRFIDLYRSSKRQPSESLEDTNSPVVAMDERSLEDVLIDQQQLENMLQVLSPSQRELLFLWGVESYTAKEIATLLGEPIGTVLSRIHRLRKMLQQQFGPGVGNLEHGGKSV